MPELPDVEGFRAVLAEHATGRQIEHVEVLDAGVLRDVSARHLMRSLWGHRFGDPERHGKWLIARTDGPALLMHFGMAGGLHWSGSRSGRHRHDRVLAGLGPDALGVGRADFDRALEKGDRPAGGRQAVKAALMDQSVIAGLGNLLADEILWRARIHPRRPVRELGPADRARVHGQLRRVLRAAIPAGRVPARAGWLTGRRDDDGARCPRCGAALARDRMAGRTTVWCPNCQPADR